MTYLILLTLVLFVVVASQVTRITELLADIRGEKNPDNPTKGDNKRNALLMLAFLIGVMYFCYDQYVTYKPFLLPVSASAHGVGTDSLLNINFLIIGLVFFVTQVLLFWYAFKYKAKEGNKATYYPDNHKLETIWTIVPTIVLVVLIVYGLKTWNGIVEPAPKDALQVELYAKQFDWTVRYPGNDNALGNSYYKFIADNNVVGIDTNDTKGMDDVLAKEIHLPVNRAVDFVFHSRDVIHSAYMPHFRVQMNCVPGMSTKFHFKPTITTAQMREITKNENFEYVVLCNKICGVAHFNMKMKIVVETEEEYNKWLKEQKAFAQVLHPAAEAPAAAPAATDSAAVKTAKVVGVSGQVSSIN